MDIFNGDQSYHNWLMTDGDSKIFSFPSSQVRHEQGCRFDADRTDESTGESDGLNHYDINYRFFLCQYYRSRFINLFATKC